MTESPQPQPVPFSIDLSTAGWFLLITGIWELLFNRLASAVGLYSGVGATGFLRWVAESGRLAMNACGIMALILACAILPRIASNQRFAPLSARVVLMLASPFYLPIICVATLRAISAELVLVGYMVTVGSALFISILVALRNIDSNRRRIIIALGLIQMLCAFELVARVAALFHPTGTLEALPRRAYLFAEILFVITPIFAFFVLRPGQLGAFLRRPHLAGLVFACIAVCIGVYSVIFASEEAFFKLIAFRTLGITVAIPGGAPIYIVALFFGTLLTGSLILPSHRWPPDSHSRRIGFGLVFVWIAGIQPTHPYQFTLMLLGFLYLARGLLGEKLERQVPVAPIAVRQTEL
ncbi:MAG: hypothetical protein GY847_01860 [Proteobacteria bacterium]|nr:hypothetical protein [Pseudomonadota bacterium]